MANLPFWRGEDPFRTLFQEIQKTFEDFSRRSPFARFSSSRTFQRSTLLKARTRSIFRPNCRALMRRMSM
jgi:hypothetical protein